MARTDFFDDLAAPAPNTLAPAASAVVTDPDGRILLVRRTDTGTWALPGGTMEPGETIARCAEREVREETGLHVTVTGLVGIYTDPRHVIAYSDGEVRQQFNVCFTAEATGGEIRGSAESTAVAFHTPSEIARLPMHPTQRLRIDNHLDPTDTPHLG